ncbi:MAG: hypothetical protein QOE09_2002 [Ilumatobacteraceae bacterium]|jgi:hypothetical protein
MSAIVQDVRPPAIVVRVLNPLMRALLGSRLARRMKNVAMIEFSGRRSGRQFRIPVGWHHTDGMALVVTPASWRTNFAGGRSAKVHHGGHVQPMIGTLVTDAAEVAQAVQAVLDAGTPPRQLGLRVPSGHRVLPSEISNVNRALIRFE